MLRLLVLVVGLALVPFTPISRPVIPAPLAIEAKPAPESQVAAVQITAVAERHLVFDCQPAAPNQQELIADCNSRWVEEN